MTYAEWCAVHNCDHAHCPLDCAKPQPFVIDGVLYCGKHWNDEMIYLPMVPCNKETCSEE